MAAPDSTALEITQPSTIPTDALALTRAPSMVLSEARRAAKVLTSIIEAKPNKLSFNGKTYLCFEDWQTLGRFYGVTALCLSTKYIEYGEGDDRIRGFEARADALLVSTNQVISSAEAMCLDDERNWGGKPLFQLRSMAQTRACAKVLRNVLAWVAVLAGFAGTPAEEMEDAGNAYGVQSPRRKSQIPVAPMDGVHEDIAAAFDEPARPFVPAQTISVQQQKRLFAIAGENGVSHSRVREILGQHGFEKSSEITRSAYASIVAELGQSGRAQ
jgi:hypothetical protein